MMGKISFGVKKVESSKVDQTKVIQVVDDAVDEAGEEQVIIRKKKPEEYIIPLINKNNWRLNGKSSGDQLADQAVQELIDESRGVGVKEHEDRLDLTVPMLERNRVPEGYEDGSKLDASCRPDMPTEADYEQIPVEMFGMAMLRGMGWKEKEGIGRTFKQNVAPHQTKLRPIGLGLGAAQAQQQSNHKKRRPIETLTKDDYVIAVGGTHKHKCGIVMSLDVDLGRCDVAFAGDERRESVSENLLKKIGRDEYKSYSDRVAKPKPPPPSSSALASSNGKKRASLRGDVNGGSSPKKMKKRRKKTWLQPNLKVRIVDERLGKHYKEKVVVEDVYTADGVCLCRTMNGKLLDNLNEDQLETVIPKTTSGGEASYIVITNHDKYKGKLARILQKDRDECTVYLQLIEDRDVSMTLGFDEVCEYVGDAEHNDMF